MDRADASDEGGISIQSLITFLVVVLITWGLVAFFPLFNVPDNLENTIEELCLGYLRLPTREKAKPEPKQQLVKDIQSATAEILKEHRYDPKEVKKSVEFRGYKIVHVQFDYTIVITFLGMEYTFDKVLEVHRRSANF